MSDATYRIKARKNINGKPLLIVTFNVDYEVLLDQERFEQLSSTVVKYSDGVEGERSFASGGTSSNECGPSGTPWASYRRMPRWSWKPTHPSYRELCFI